MTAPGGAPVVLATRSAGKLAELRPLFLEYGVAVESLADAGIAAHADEDALECHDTFEANALAKATWFSDVARGRLVVADDSGLEVEALDGAPGVHSKRWAGHQHLSEPSLDEANNRFLQAQLRRAAELGHDSRAAQYVCAAAAVWAGGALVVRGTTTGSITAQARGQGGFGYDPYFLSAELGVTFAEVSREAKSAVSHRGRAFRLLLSRLWEMGVLSGRTESIVTSS